MAEIAEVGIKIDSDDIKGAIKELDRLEDSSSDAEKATKDLETSQKKATDTMNKWGVAVAAAGAALALAFAKSIINSNDELAKMSTRLGVSTEALSQYQHVAELSGVSFNTLTMGWQRMSRRIAEAAQGTGEATGALKELGLGAEALNQLDIDQQFEIIADRLGLVENASDRTRLAMKLFDSEGVALLQTMKNGSAGLIQMRQEADDLGLTLSMEAAQASEEFNDKLTVLMATLKGTGKAATEDLLPALTAMVNIVAQGIIEFTDIGNALGAFAAASIAFVKFDFDTAKSILALRREERVEIDKKIDAIWATKRAQESLNDSQKEGATMRLAGASIQGISDTSETEGFPGMEEMEFRASWIQANQDAELMRAKDHETSLKIAAEQGARDRANIAKASMGLTTNLMSALLMVQDTTNKSGFEKNKKLQLVQVGINTASAITRAYSDLGPVAGSIAAIGIAGIGVAQASVIQSTQYGGGANISTSVGSISTGGETVPGQPTNQPQGGESAQRALQLNVTVNGSVVGADLEEVIANAMREGDRRDLFNIRVEGRRAQIL